jgi:lactoylglutathione lyase
MALPEDSLPMFRKVDCLLLRVPDVAAALSFYRDRLGMKLAWMRVGEAAGLAMRDSDSELVLLQEPGLPETDLLVDSADEACRQFITAGGELIRPPFDIPIGRCAVVRDPWGNDLVLLDMTKGPLKVDSDGHVID